MSAAAFRLSLCSLAALLSACALVPAYERPQTAAIVLQAPQASGFAQAGESVAPWWTFLQEPRLTQHVAQALAHNHDIRQAQASLEAARAEFEQRRQEQLPGVTAQSAYQRSVQPRSLADGQSQRGLSQSWRSGFDVQWELDVWGRLGHVSQAAQARSEASEAQLALVQLSIAAEVARAYYEVQGAQRQLALAQAQLGSWRETEQLVQTRMAQGSALAEDAQQARAMVLRMQADVGPLLALVAQWQYRLDVLTGQRPGQGPVAAGVDAPAPLARQLPLGDVDQLIRSRPDVRQAERLLAASSEDVGAAKADLYPRLNLGGFIGFLALGGSDLGSAARAFEWLPGMRWPLLGQGNTRSRLRGSQALAQGALARYEQSLLQAQEEVENAVTQLAEHQTRLSALLQSGVHANQALGLVRKRYAQGAASYLAVLERQRTVLEIETALVGAETASYLHVIALYKALGWGSSPSLPAA